MGSWIAVLLAVLELLIATAHPAAPAAPAQPPAGDPLQVPLHTWAPHCLGFGSEWRYCNGVALRACPSGAVWLHTGTDVVASVGPPVAVGGDGVVAGDLVDPAVRGGVLIRHQLTTGVVITQYWHVWLRPGFAVGTSVRRG